MSKGSGRASGAGVHAGVGPRYLTHEASVSIANVVVRWPSDDGARHPRPYPQGTQAHVSPEERRTRCPQVWTPEVSSGAVRHVSRHPWCPVLSHRGTYRREMQELVRHIKNNVQPTWRRASALDEATLPGAGVPNGVQERRKGTSLGISRLSRLGHAQGQAISTFCGAASGQAETGDRLARSDG